MWRTEQRLFDAKSTMHPCRLTDPNESMSQDIGA